MNILCCCQYYSVLCYNNPVANIGERATIHLSPFAISDHQQAMGLHAGLTHFGDPRSSRNSSLTAWQILQGKNPIIFNIIRWFSGPMGQTNRRPSVWCSKYLFFHKILQNSLRKPFQFIFVFFYKITKMKIKSFEGCRGHIFCTEIKILNSESHDISQKLRKSKCLLFHFFSNKVDQNTIFAKLPSAKWLFLVWLYISAIKSWKVYT